MYESLFYLLLDRCREAAPKRRLQFKNALLSLVGVVIAALLIASSLMMRVPTGSHIGGYPTLAIAGYLIAAIAAVYLIISTLIRDKQDREKAKQKGR